MIAPPTAAMTFQHIEPSTPERIHTVWCDDDDFVDSNYFADKPNVECLTLSGGGHFFAGQADNLASAVVSALIRSPIRE
jgi:alpha/beta superfamily hydrolase